MKRRKKQQLEPQEAQPKAWSPRKIRRGLWLRFFFATILIISVTSAATAKIGILFLNDIVPIPGKDNDIGFNLPATKSGEPQTILLLGSDRRFKDKKLKLPSRSDTMMLVRLNPKTKITTLLSLPRDLRVNIHTKNGLITDKLNVAYTEGGTKLTVNTIQELLHVQINHVINVTFGGFQRSVNEFGGFYVDIDRRYFNDNNPPVASPTDYATIDIQPGYQRLVGSDSLDYVRFRHLDTDLIRSKRQQGYLQSAKQQVGVQRIYDDRKQLAKILGRYTETDIDSSKAVIRLLKLVYAAAQGTVHEVKFQGSFDKQFVVTTASSLTAMHDEFLHPKPVKKQPKKQPKKQLKKRKKKSLKPQSVNVINAQTVGENQAITAAAKADFPVMYPKVLAGGSQYIDSPRVYNLRDTKNHVQQAYRMVIKGQLDGEYYGIQGLTWQNPPILKNPSETRKIGKRTFLLFYDGSDLKLVGWRTKQAAYWVANTLSRSLTNGQMLAIAKSTRQVGRRG